ncbi:S-adenosyl-L-methionine-dependent methyltransferase [Phytophthora cactorum]|nr:S-adenosyl-L-methionine-dependent methyltransferase [Phytophthora cactorum]
MVRTSFSFDDDKQLVHLARAYEDDGSRICWNDVAHSMRSTGHTPATQEARLRYLMCTHGNRVSGFPVKFFSPVHRPHGRPPAIVRQLHALRAVPRDEHRAHLRTGEHPQHHEEDVRLPTRSNEVTRSPAATQSPEALEPLPLDALEVVITSSPVERAVVEIFADVPRETVIEYDGRSIHHNVGEILPGGVSILLRGLQFDERGKFVDIGAGLGNVIAQVILQTKVYQ